MKKTWLVTVATQYDVEAETPEEAQKIIEDQLNAGTLEIHVRDCWIEQVDGVEEGECS